MFSVHCRSALAALLTGLCAAAVVGTGSASADDVDRTAQNAISYPDTGAPPVIPRPKAPGPIVFKPKPVLTVPVVKPIPRPVPRPRPVSVIPPGTGGIKPPRPSESPELLGPPLVIPPLYIDPVLGPIYPWGPKPQPPKPIKNPLITAGPEAEPGPPIVRPDRFPPAAEVR